MGVIRELTVALGFEVDSKSIAAAERSFGRLKTAAIGIVGAVTAATGAVVAATFEVAAYGDELEDTARRIGVGVEALQGLEFAAKLSGSSVEGMRSGLQALSRQAGNAGRGVKVSSALFRELGIQVKNSNGQIRPTEDLLGDVADRLSGMSDQSRRVAIAQKLLGSAGVELLPTLLDGREGLAKMREEASRLGIVLSSKATKAAAEFSDEYDKAKASVVGVVREIAAEFLPVMTNLVRGFRDWFAANRQIIAQRLRDVFSAVAQGLEFAFVAGQKMFAIASALLPRLGGLKGIALAVSGAFAGSLVGALVSAASAIAKLAGALGIAKPLLRFLILPGTAALAWGALAAAVALIIEDIITYVDGGESAVGDFFDMLAEPKNVKDHWTIKLMKDIREVALSAKTAVVELFDYINVNLLSKLGIKIDRSDLDKVLSIFSVRNSVEALGRATPLGGLAAGAQGAAALAAGGLDFAGQASDLGRNFGNVYGPGPNVGDINQTIVINATGTHSPSDIGREAGNASKKATNDAIDQRLRDASIMGAERGPVR